MRDIYCAVTDNDWFDFLRSQDGLSEINFWKPTPQTFKAVSEGGIFAFKLKAPRSKIAGFGVLTTSADSQICTSWDAFGLGNGLPDLDTFVRKIRAIKGSPEINEYSFIGVRVLVHHVFFPEDLWFDPPEGWADNIVTGKTYSTGTTVGMKLLSDLEVRAGSFSNAISPPSSFVGLSDPREGFGSPIPAKPRLGQGTFRVNVAKAYANECVLSGTRVTPALEAAHIIPFSQSKDHSIQNGLLMRKDIHSVFDAGFATFDEQGCFLVSRQVKEIFNNGREYRKLHGKRMRSPVNPEWSPSASNLRWHRETKYVGD